MADYYISKFDFGKNSEAGLVTYISRYEDGHFIEYSDSDRNGAGLDAIKTEVFEDPDSNSAYTSYFVRDSHVRNAICSFNELTHQSCANIIVDSEKINERARFFAGLLKNSEAEMAQFQRALSERRIFKIPQNDKNDSRYDFYYQYNDSNGNLRKTKVSYVDAELSNQASVSAAKLVLQTDRGDSFVFKISEGDERTAKAYFTTHATHIKEREKQREKERSNQAFTRESYALEQARLSSQVTIFNYLDHKSIGGTEDTYIFKYRKMLPNGSSKEKKITFYVDTSSKIQAVELDVEPFTFGRSNFSDLDPTNRAALQDLFNKLKMLPRT